MNLLTMEHITKSYTDRILLDDVAFSINENEKIKKTFNKNFCTNVIVIAGLPNSYGLYG